MRNGGLVAVLLTLISCEPSPPTQCTARISQAIVNGGETELLLELDEAALDAIVRIDDAEGGTVCSGTLIAPQWALTAGHCATIAERVWSPGVDASVDIIERHSHLDRDAALVRLASAVPATPFELEGTPLDDRWLGKPVELAGYGLTETNELGALRFAVEPIVAMTKTTIRVGSGGERGACSGDSGGPLLIRSPDGTVRLAGLLSAGSMSCLGEDDYLRASAIAAWAAETSGVETGRRAESCSE